MNQKLLNKVFSLNKKHITILLCIIVLIGGFLRLQNFEERLRFNNDQVRDAKIVNNMITNSQFPLLGPKAGGTTFKLGPAYYHLSYISGKIFGNTPSGIALFIPILGTLSIILFYLFIKNFFHTNISLVLTFLYSTSFFAIKYSSFAWNPNAIPFFLFLFLVALFYIAKSRNFLWYGALGIAMGIGMQLHTTLLVLFPAILLFFVLYLFYKKQNFSISGIFLSLLITGLFLSPMILYDTQNNWENTRSFFAGTETKSANETNLVERAILTGEFYVKGTSYTLTSTEAKRNWLYPKKLFLTKSFNEITTLILGTALFITGIIFLRKKYQKEKIHEEKNALYITLFTLIGLCSILFFALAEELNIRFFIILLPLPFILLGVYFEKISNLNISTKSMSLLISTIVCILFLLNMSTYATAYDFSKRHENKSLYGGISVSELQKIIDYAAENAVEKNIFMTPHRYGKSIKYFARKNDLSLQTKKPKSIPEGSMSLFLSDKPHENTIAKKYQDCFDVQEQKTLGRLKLFLLKRNNAECQD